MSVEHRAARGRRQAEQVECGTLAKERGEFRRELTELYIRGTSLPVDLIPLSDDSIDLDLVGG